MPKLSSCRKTCLFPSPLVLFGFLILVFYFKHTHEERRRLMHNLEQEKLIKQRVNLYE
jgi:hypothetical protein